MQSHVPEGTFPTIKISDDLDLTSNDFSNRFGEALQHHSLVFLDLQTYRDGETYKELIALDTLFTKMVNEMTLDQRRLFDHGFFEEGTYYSNPETPYGKAENIFWLHFRHSFETYLEAYSKLKNEGQRLPESFEAYFKTAQRFFPFIESLGHQLVASLESYLNLQPNSINRFMHNGESFTGENTILAIRYTPPEGMPSNRSTEVMAAHTGPCLATIAIAQSQPGLEVFVNNEWVRVPVKPGHLFFMCDDQMELLTQESSTPFTAIPHRVTVGSKPRNSMLFFMSPNQDAVIDENGTTFLEYARKKHPLRRKVNNDDVIVTES